MTDRIRLVVFCALFGTVMPAAAAEQWFCATTLHFEICAAANDTTIAQKRIHEDLLSFEGVRSVVIEATRADWNQVIPVRLVSFQSGKQFKPYAPENAQTSYSSGNQSRDYFVMTESDPDHLPVSLHQFTHLALQRTRLKTPTWLNEGLAELLSTLRPAGTDFMVGGVLKDHVTELKSVKWLDFDTLTTVNDNSPNYNENNRAGQFYAESWALVHMLFLGRDYRQGFGKVVAALSEGKTADEAFRVAYSRTASQVYADLQVYVKQGSFAAIAFPVGQASPAAAVLPASDEKSGLMLADLLAAMGGKDAATAAFGRLAKQYPDSPEVSESLGYLAWQNGDSESARRYFEAALPATQDPQMCYHLAMLYHDAGQSGDKLMATLARAVGLKPDYAEARLQLGLAEYNRNNYAAAIAALAPIDRIAPEHAATLYSALAYAYVRTGDFASARKSLDTGGKWNKTEAEKQRAAELAQYLEASQVPTSSAVPAGDSRPSLRRAPDSANPPGPAAKSVDSAAKSMPGGLLRVEGAAQSLDCAGAQPRLVVTVGDAVMTFAVDAPTQVILRHEGSGGSEFICGSMNNLHVVVDYVPGTSPATGLLRAIQF